MRLNTSTIGVAAVVTLFASSTTLTEAIGFSRSASPSYYDQPLNVWNAFGKKELMITKMPSQLGVVDYLEGKLNKDDVTITCVDPKSPEARTIQTVYQLIETSTKISKWDSKSRYYFARSELTLRSSNKQCYVSKGVCKWWFYKQQSESMSKRFLWKALQLKVKWAYFSVEKAIHEIWSTGYTYHFMINDICYDANDRMLFNRYESAVPMQEAYLSTLTKYDDDLSNIIYMTCTRVFRYESLRRVCGEQAFKWLLVVSNTNRLKQMQRLAGAPPSYTSVVSSSSSSSSSPPPSP
ncbi:hypothetical protein BDF22DRAFT_701806 [Syncephalis plumigaleata]|nr:hypothetical protein BDF22DRAFT_701806 [Syncephalis plumigaleata]